MDIETLKMNTLMELIDLKHEAMENPEVDHVAKIQELELIRRLVRLAYVANCLRNEGPSVLPVLEDELDQIFTEDK
jgi:hypothetical protein